MKRTPGVKYNLIANILGKTSTSFISLLVMPLYIKLIGIESYGLIGVYVAMTALIQFLDLGLTTTMNREMARLSALEGTEQESRDLVRTLEVLYWTIGIAVGAGIFALAPLIAHHWIHTQKLSPIQAQYAVMIMGLLFAFQWPDSFYAGGLMGLQRQPLLNGIRVVVAVGQAVGALLILKFVSPTILAYFGWQAVVYGIQTLVLAGFLWSALPHTAKKARYRRELWIKNSRFTAGVTVISITSTILTQADKLLLSKQLPLTLFGYYALAAALAANLLFPVAPLFTAVFPKLAQLAANDRTLELAQLYHKSCQLLAMIIVPIWIVIALFSRQVLMLYLHDAQTVAHVHLLLALLVTGTALNALMMLPFGLQLAYGYTKLSAYKNIIAVIVFVPALAWMTHRFGAVGAAWMWVILNGAYIAFEIPFMHRRLLPGEMWRWYGVDVGLPLIVTLCIIFAARWMIRDTLPLPMAVLGMCIAGIAAFGATGIALQFTRRSIASRTGLC